MLYNIFNYTKDVVVKASETVVKKYIDYYDNTTELEHKLYGNEKCSLENLLLLGVPVVVAVPFHKKTNHYLIKNVNEFAGINAVDFFCMEIFNGKFRLSCDTSPDVKLPEMDYSKFMSNTEYVAYAFFADGALEIIKNTNGTQKNIVVASHINYKCFSNTLNGTRIINNKLKLSLAYIPRTDDSDSCLIKKKGNWVYTNVSLVRPFTESFENKMYIFEDYVYRHFSVPRENTDIVYRGTSFFSFKKIEISDKHTTTVIECLLH